MHFVRFICVYTIPFEKRRQVAASAASGMDGGISAANGEDGRGRKGEGEKERKRGRGRGRGREGEGEGKEEEEGEGEGEGEDVAHVHLGRMVHGAFDAVVRMGVLPLLASGFHFLLVRVICSAGHAVVRVRVLLLSVGVTSLVRMPMPQLLLLLLLGRRIHHDDILLLPALAAGHPLALTSSSRNKLVLRFAMVVRMPFRVAVPVRHQHRYPPSGSARACFERHRRPPRSVGLGRQHASLASPDAACGHNAWCKRHGRYGDGARQQNGVRSAWCRNAGARHAAMHREKCHV